MTVFHFGAEGSAIEKGEAVARFELIKPHTTKGCHFTCCVCCCEFAGLCGFSLLRELFFSSLRWGRFVSVLCGVGEFLGRPRCAF
jgi:hypothetical protein